MFLFNDAPRGLPQEPGGRSTLHFRFYPCSHDGW
jgi:hypothetical protein